MAKTALSPEELVDVDVHVPGLRLYLHRFWEGLKNAVSELCKSTTAMIGALMLLVLLALCLLTPHIARESLYKKSGHLPYYAESMFPPMDLITPRRKRVRDMLLALNRASHRANATLIEEKVDKIGRASCRERV